MGSQDEGRERRTSPPPEAAKEGAIHEALSYIDLASVDIKKAKIVLTGLKGSIKLRSHAAPAALALASAIAALQRASDDLLPLLDRGIDEGP